MKKSFFVFVTCLFASGVYGQSAWDYVDKYEVAIAQKKVNDYLAKFRDYNYPSFFYESFGVEGKDELLEAQKLNIVIKGFYVNPEKLMKAMGELPINNYFYGQSSYYYLFPFITKSKNVLEVTVNPKELKPTLNSICHVIDSTRDKDSVFYGKFANPILQGLIGGSPLYIELLTKKRALGYFRTTNSLWIRRTDLQMESEIKKVQPIKDWEVIQEMREATLLDNFPK